VSWGAAAAEISTQSGLQFDPDIVNVFRQKKEGLHRLFELTTAA
jgi:HD-GYP domain-containing protein (c-di-GMP phosphodiesterase class II)